jgi:site-specific recombinase XerD
MLLETLIDGFLLDCRARNLSPSTIERAYEPCLRNLCTWLSNPEVTAITTEDLRRFIVHLGQSKAFERGHPWVKEQHKGLSAWTIHNNVRTIKRLFNWACQEGIVPASNPATKLAHPKMPTGKVKIFSRDEIDLLLREAKSTSFRNYAIVFLLLDSGIRRGELVALTLADVNAITGVVTVRHGKGDKQRAVRVGNACRKAVWRYANEFRQPLHPEVDALFLDRHGRPLKANAVALMLRRLGERTGLHVHAHKFRHTFATMFATRVPNALLLADALGHETLEMSQKYVHLAGTQSTDAHLSPMDWLLTSEL